MQVRTKRRIGNKAIKLIAQGQIKEVRIKEDILNPDKQIFEICFKGASSSGIVDLSKEELDSIVKQVSPKVEALKGIKVLKFKK